MNQPSIDSVGELAAQRDARWWLVLYLRLAAISRELHRTTSLSATAVAVLLTLGQVETAPAQVLCRCLNADVGYVSRILSDFEQRGWVTSVVPPSDRRYRNVTLTALGSEQCTRVADAATDILKSHLSVCARGLRNSEM